jgi:hypothetical protein
MKAFMGVLVLGLSAMALVMFLRGGQETSGKAPVLTVKFGAAGTGDLIAPASVLRIAPRSSTAYVAPPAPRRSPFATEMNQAKAWKPIYERLRNSPEGKTPEGLYYLAQILSACANVADRKAFRRAPAVPASPDEARARFLRSVSEKDPNRTARLAAYDVARSERCSDLREVETTEKEIRDLREQAAASGDAKARAALVSEDVFATVRMPPDVPPGPTNGLPMISDAQLDALRQAVRSGDPGAAQIAGGVLASTMGDLQILAGPNEQPVDPRAFHDAWQLAACELGANCGPDNGQLAHACAYEGRCGVDNLRDYFFYYGHSPAQSQNVGEYSQQILNAIRTGDWSYFNFVRGVPPIPGSVFRFGGTR